MKKIALSLCILITTWVNAQSTWKVDESHSSINFSVSHLIISETTGSFDAFDITATTGANFENPQFNVTIETASINTKNTDRDDHLKADDFFDAAKFPSIVFKSESIEKTGEKTFKLAGDITIKGVTKKAYFEGKLNGVVDTKYGKKAGLKLTTVIDRTQFNVGGSGGSIGKEVTVVVNLEMNKA